MLWQGLYVRRTGRLFTLYRLYRSVGEPQWPGDGRRDKLRLTLRAGHDQRDAAWERLKDGREIHCRAHVEREMTHHECD